MGPVGTSSGTKVLQSLLVSLSGLKGHHCFALSFRSPVLLVLFLRGKKKYSLPHNPSLLMTEPHRQDPARLPPLWFPWPPHLGEIRRAIVRKGPDIPESSSRGQQEPPVAPPTGLPSGHLCRWLPQPSSCWRQKGGQSVRAAGTPCPGGPRLKPLGFLLVSSPKQSSHWISSLKRTGYYPQVPEPPTLRTSTPSFLTSYISQRRIMPTLK